MANMMANKIRVGFEPGWSVALDSATTINTDPVWRFNLGPLAALTYKPVTMRYSIDLSSAPTQGEAELKLIAGAQEVYSEVLGIQGSSRITGAAGVDLSQVAGEQEVYPRVVVTGAADAGITATVNVALDIEQPLTLAGC